MIRASQSPHKAHLLVEAGVAVAHVEDEEEEEEARDDADLPGSHCRLRNRGTIILVSLV